ncbi:YDG domain-containing protein [Cupriavidus sp. D39]|uniref:YDG domain-containing protein n=1 Tax=Cupriavidus sp. D39 TaxID=2997877 RepID=UPI0022705B64|nr:YDG domain-containing protein [Cupriavidus sp. D39]MCY0858736.1 YDG domain-containing protein [Cupriavidus sp. D39]
MSGATASGVNGETLVVTANGAVGVFSTMHAGNNLAVSISNVTVANGTGLVSDYNVTALASTATANITPAGLTVAASGGTKVYDGLNGSVAVATVTGLKGSDTVSNASLAEVYASPHVQGSNGSVLNVAAALGNASLGGGGYVTDYNVSYVAANGTITPATVTLSGVTANNKVYDGTSVAGVNVSGASASGVNGETLVVTANGAVGVFSTTHAGNNLAVSISNVTVANGTGLVSDYNVTALASTATANITPAGLTVAASGGTKVYDGLNGSVAVATVTGLKGSDTVSNASLAEVYASPHVQGSNGSVLNVAAALGNASLGGGGYVTDYNVSYVAANGTITPAGLTVAASGGTKVYDGLNGSMAVATVTGLKGSDTVSNASLAEVYASPHVQGSNGSVLNVAAALGNASLGGGGYVTDYNVSYVAANGTITPATVTLSGVTANNKVYDGTSVAGVNVSGASASGVNGETLVVTANGAVGVFSTTHAGNNLAVSISNVTVANGTGLVSDYNVTALASTATANITPAGLTVAASGGTKVYDGLNGSVAVATVTGLKGSDTVSNASLAEVYASPHVQGSNGSVLNVAAALGNASLGGGGYVTDYNVSYVAANGTITPAGLTVAASGGTKVYDGLNGSMAVATVTGLKGSDTVSNASLAEVYASPHVQGSNGSVLNVAAALGNASLGGGGYVTDYNVSYVAANGTITPATLTVAANGGTKVYDGLNGSMAVATVTGLKGSDTVSNASLAEVYASPHVQGSNGSVLNVAAALGNASLGGGGYVTDYNVSYVAANGTITKAGLTVTASGGTKVYDGLNGSVAVAAVTGLKGSDTVSNASLAEVYASPHALGSNSSVLNVAAALGNASLGGGGYVTDYNVSYVAANGTITKATVTLSGVTANNKVYDGTSVAGVNVSGASASGVNGETLVVTANGAVGVFSTTHAGNNLAVSISNVTVANGTGLVSDYNVTALASTATANITPATLTVTANGGTKVYDGLNGSVAVATVTGLKGSDTVSNASLAEVYASPHVQGANGSVLNVAAALGNASLGGGGYVTDYNVSYVAANGTITPAGLTVTASGGTKVYDGLNGSAAVAAVTGLKGSDTVSNASLAEVYASPHALGSNSSVLNVAAALGNASLGGGGYVTDYNVSYVAANGTITKATVTLSGVTANNKVYDGTSVAGVNVSGASASGVNGETLVVTANGAVGVFSTTHAGNNLAVSISNVTVANGTGLVSDYNVTALASTATANITPATLTVTANGGTKVYDGLNGSVAVATVTGLKGSDTVSNASLAEVYASPHVQGANGSVLNVAAALGNASLGGGGYVTDYNVSYVAANGTITPAGLTVTASGGTKVYDGLNGSAAVAAVTGLKGSDTVSNASLAEVYASPHALGSNSSVLNVAAALGNASLGGGGYVTDYNVSYVAANGTITKATVTLSGVTANNKVYDGTSVAGVNVSGASASGVNGETLVVTANGAVGVFSTTHAGNNLAVSISNVTVANGTGLVSDYNVTALASTATANITPATLTVTANGGTKVYDGLNGSVAVATVTGLKGSDTVSNASLAEVYASPHVQGANGSVLNVAAALGNASLGGGGYVTDYNVSYVAANGTITPAGLTVTASGGTKVYDGLNGSAAVAAVTGLKGSDTVSNASLAEVYASPHALGSNSSVLNVAAALGNASLGGGGYVTDYNVSYVAANGTITKATVTLSGVTANNKVYDGTSVAGVNVSGASASGVNGETLVVTANGAVGVFSTTHAGNNLAVSISNVTVANGTGLVSDYNVTALASTATANITPATLTVTANGGTKVYDGLNGSVAVATVTGLKGSDTVSNASLAEVYASPHVQGANGSVLNVAAALGNASLGGGGYVTDYNVSYVAANGTITPAGLTVTASGGTKVYDGLNGSAAVAAVTGLKGSDTVSNASLAEVYASPHALGSNSSVLNVAAALGNASLGGGGYVTDYNVSYVAANGTITKAPLTVTGIAASDKTYDTNNLATLTSTGTLSGLIGAETLVLNTSGVGATFSDVNAAHNKTVTATGYALANGTNGGLASDYQIVSNPTTTASILQINELTPAQIAATSPSIVAVQQPGWVSSMNSTQLSALAASSVVALPTTALDALSPAQIASLSPTALTALMPAQLSSLSVSQVQVLTPAQIASLSPTALAALTPAQLGSLTLSQVQVLTPAQIASLSPTALAALPPAQLSSLSVSQVQVLTPAQIASLNPTALAALTPAQLGSLTLSQVQVLTPAQITSLSPTALAALTPAQLSSLTLTQVQALTPAQITSLSPTALAALTPAQLSSLTLTQVQALTPAQIGVLSGTQLAAVQGSKSALALRV